MSMVDLIDAITRGIDLYSFFYSKYYGPIKYRPLTNFELSTVIEDAVSGKPWEVKEFLRDLQIKHVLPPSIPREMSRDLVKAYEHMCALVVYHAVKDFQKENWQHVRNGIPLGMALLEGPDNYLEVESMAGEVLALSSQPREVLESFIETEGGERLASAVWKLDYQLTDAMWKLTDLQFMFIIKCREHERKARDLAELKAALPHPITPTTPEENALIEKCEQIKKRIRG